MSKDEILKEEDIEIDFITSFNAIKILNKQVRDHIIYFIICILMLLIIYFVCLKLDLSNNIILYSLAFESCFIVFLSIVITKRVSKRFNEISIFEQWIKLNIKKR